MMTLGLSLFIISVLMIAGGAASTIYGLYTLFTVGTSAIFVAGFIALLLGVVLSIIIFSNDLLRKKNTTSRINNSSHGENDNYAYSQK